MSTSDSGAPPPHPRKMVLRKIAKDASFPSETSEAPPAPVTSTFSGVQRPSALPPPLPSALRQRTPSVAGMRRSELDSALQSADARAAQGDDGGMHASSIADSPVEGEPVWPDRFGRHAAPGGLPSSGSTATPVPSRISVTPFVAPIPAPTRRGPSASGGPPRYVLIVCGIALSGILVGAGVLLGTRMDESPSRATAATLHPPAGAAAPPRVAAAVANGSPKAPTAETPMPSNPLIATANVNDLPRAPAPAIRRSPPSAYQAFVRSAPRVQTPALPQAPPSEATTSQGSESVASASAPPAAATASTTALAAPGPEGSATPPTAPTASAIVVSAPAPKDTPPAKPASSADTPGTSDPAPAPAPDPLLEEIKKAVGGSHPK